MEKNITNEHNSYVRPEDFYVGFVIKMNPGPRSHESRPYFVEVIEVSPSYIVTHIPKYWSCKMIFGHRPCHSSNWDYHIRRMELVGTIETHGHLLYNQQLTFKKPQTENKQIENRSFFRNLWWLITGR